jgi:NAD(P)-dependent dehydrogenase (short-subunit alcohol dehydrogenase family)
MCLDGHTAVITGAGRGIGRAIALELAKRGADITIADLRSDEMEETKALIEDCGQDAAMIRTDLRDSSVVDACIAQAIERFESIEILVNNAGIAGPNLPCENVSVADWDETLAVNLRGAFLMCRGVLSIMKDNEYGRIVNISSVTGKRPVAKRTPYAASKLGLIGLTRSLAAEVGDYNINVNAVCPGSVEGPRINRVFERYAEDREATPEAVKQSEIEKSARSELVTPESVSQLVAMLCSKESSQMTGQDINISAGKVMY